MHPQQQEDVVAYRAAFALAEVVRQGGRPAAVPPTIALRRGELQHGAPLMEASSFYGMDVEYSTGWVVGGGLLFTAVGLAASAAGNAAAKNRAERQARPQWRALGLAPTVVTSRRLMVMINYRWAGWDLDEIVANQLDIPARTLIVTFQGEQPLMLRGPWAAWTGVVISSATSGLPWPPGTVFPPLPQPQVPRPLAQHPGPPPLGRPAPAQGYPVAPPPQPDRMPAKPAAGHPPAQPALPIRPAAPVPPNAGAAASPHAGASFPPHAAAAAPPYAGAAASPNAASSHSAAVPVPPRAAVLGPPQPAADAQHGAADAPPTPQPGPDDDAPARLDATADHQEPAQHPQYQLDPAVVRQEAYEGEVLPPVPDRRRPEDSGPGP